MNNKPFDPTKPVQTRSGLPARILITNRKAPIYTIVAMVDEGPENEIVRVYTSEGFFSFFGFTDDRDLVNVSEKRVLEFWRNLYPNNYYYCDYPTKEIADQRAERDRIACLHFKQEYIVGEGL